jgi:DNA-binding NarL/FixJ family response regulator
MSPRIEVTALVPWTRAILATQNKRAPRSVVRAAYETTFRSGNIDAFVTAYRACPELLQVVAADKNRRDDLRTCLARARDHQLAKTAGFNLPPLAKPVGSPVLTKREHEVIELVAQGLTNKEIGRTLFITEATAKKHVQNACAKLGVRRRTEAAMRVSELIG